MRPVAVEHLADHVQARHDARRHRAMVDLGEWHAAGRHLGIVPSPGPFNGEDRRGECVDDATALVAREACDRRRRLDAGRLDERSRGALRNVRADEADERELRALARDRREPPIERREVLARIEAHAELRPLACGRGDHPVAARVHDDGAAHADVRPEQAAGPAVDAFAGRERRELGEVRDAGEGGERRAGAKTSGTSAW
jgi:hypothetical protein